MTISPPPAGQAIPVAMSSSLSSGIALFARSRSSAARGRAGNPRGQMFVFELVLRGLRAFELLRERPVEIGKRPGHLALPVLDLVKLLLHPGGEGKVHQVRKRLLEEVRDDPSELRGEELPF